MRHGRARTYNLISQSLDKLLHWFRVSYGFACYHRNDFAIKILKNVQYLNLEDYDNVPHFIIA